MDKQDLKSPAASLTPEKGSSSGVARIFSTTAKAVPTLAGLGGDFL